MPIGCFANSEVNNAARIVVDVDVDGINHVLGNLGRAVEREVIAHAQMFEIKGRELVLIDSCYGLIGLNRGGDSI